MDSTCLEPGCPYASGPDPHSCSQEIGFMSKMEIDNVIKRTGNKPVLHRDAAVQVLAFDNDQWVAYDDEETLQIQAEYAQTRCLGGVMAWVSQDSQRGDLSTASTEAIGKGIATEIKQPSRKTEAWTGSVRGVGKTSNHAKTLESPQTVRGEMENPIAISTFRSSQIAWIWGRYRCSICLAAPSSLFRACPPCGSHFDVAKYEARALSIDLEVLDIRAAGF